MMRRWCVCFVILFCSLGAAAIDAVVSHSIFYSADPNKPGLLVPTIETYWQINPQSIHFTTTPEKSIVAHIRTDIIFLNDEGMIKHDRFILQTIPRANVGELAKHNIIDLRRYNLPTGLVKMKFVLTDVADTANRFVFTDSFNIYPPSKSAFYSDLQFLDTMIESGEQTFFYKNGHQQIPSCINFMDDNKNILHYYAELYQVKNVPKKDYPLVQKVFISKKENEIYFSKFLKADTIKAPGELPVSGSFNIGSLPSGNYYLNVRLENSIRRVITSNSLFFQRLNSHPSTDTIKAAANIDTGMENITVIDLDKTFISKYNLQEIRSILKMLLPFSDFAATQTINGFLKKPDEMYMRYYIYNYFAAINKKDPGKAWRDFSEKIIEVNKLYNSHGTPGYETDRGNIYLKYGPPSEVASEENESGALPYEVWQYNSLKQLNGKEITNAVFLFYRPGQMISDYKLLHSTVSGEAQNTAWRSYLYNGSQGGTNMNSRAEQYMGNR